MLDKKNNLKLFGDFKERAINAKLRFSAILFFLFFGYFLITLKIISLSVSYNQELSKNVFKQNKLITVPSYQDVGQFVIKDNLDLA